MATKINLNQLLPKLASVAVSSKVVHLSLLINCLVLLPLFVCVFYVWSLHLMKCLVSLLVLLYKQLAEQKRAGCFALIEHLLACDCKGSVSNYRYCVLVCGM